MEFLKRKNTLGSRSNSLTRKPSSKLSRSASLSDQPDEFVVVEGSSQASTDSVPFPRAASLVSLHATAVPNCEGDKHNSQHFQALPDDLALWKAKVETFEARMQDALARAEQADARLERIASGCHQDKDALHKQITALEVAKETACTREQEAIRRAEEAEVRNAHLVETLAVFQSEIAALKERAGSTHVPIPLGEEIAAEERASDYLKMREGKTYLIKSVMTGTVAKVSAIGQSLWAGQPSGGDDEKWMVVSVFRGGVTLKNVARNAYAAITTPDRWGNCNIILSETATIWTLSEHPAEREGIPYRITPTSYRNLVWDLNGGSFQNGTQISAYINQHGTNSQRGKNQAWYLVEV